VRSRSPCRRGAEDLIRSPLVELAAQVQPRRLRQVLRSTIVDLHHANDTRRDESTCLFVRVRVRNAAHEDWGRTQSCRMGLVVGRSPLLVRRTQGDGVP
jgi:hypothetical protein